MSNHLVGSCPGAVVRVTSVPVFSAECEFHAERSDHALAVRCQKGGTTQRREDCEMCPRFRGWRKDAATDEVRVQCCWSAHDPVSARMTTAKALVCVSPETSCAEAAVLAESSGVHHLPVVSDGALVGLVCACDLPASAGPDELVRHRMSTEILTLEHRANLAEAAAAMSMFKIGCLPVVADGLLTGIITRGDLARVGVPDELLGLLHCERCGDHHGVRTTPSAPGAALCLDCLHGAREAMARLELPEAD